MAIRPWLDRFAADALRIENPTSREIECTRILLGHPRQPVHFTKLEGGEAVGNLWSTRDRVAASLGIPNEQLLPKLMDAQVHPTEARIVENAPFLAQSTTDVDLRSLPIPKLFPKDAGRYVTAGGWVAGGSGGRNLSFHRILVLDKNRGACRIVPRPLRHIDNESMKAGGELKAAAGTRLASRELL